MQHAQGIVQTQPEEGCVGMRDEGSVVCVLEELQGRWGKKRWVRMDQPCFVPRMVSLPSKEGRWAWLGRFSEAGVAKSQRGRVREVRPPVPGLPAHVGGLGGWLSSPGLSIHFSLRTEWVVFAPPLPLPTLSTGQSRDCGI